MHTPHMMMSISKSLPFHSGKNPEHLAQHQDGTLYKLLPQIELALSSGWTRKDLWESLVRDGLDVNYKTRPLLPLSRAPKKSLAQPRRTAGNDGAPIPSKKILTFCTLEVP